MSVTVKLEIQGDLYPAQRDVAERIVKAIQEITGNSSNPVEINCVARRSFLGDEVFKNVYPSSLVIGHFDYHRDPL